MAPHRTPSIRLLADDLTGALDSAAEIAALAGPIRAAWRVAALDSLPPSAAFDSGTREGSEADARDAVMRLAPMLANADIAFKKLDSLLRGHSIAELVACMATGLWDACVLAPAFPYQGRITRNGQQYARMPDGGWAEAGPDLVAAFRAAGLAAQRGRPGEALAPGVTVFDAEDDAALSAIADGARAGGRRVLWAGSGGLAGAIGGHAGASAPAVPGPILGLFGSDQATTEGQLAACSAHRHTIRDGGAESAAEVLRRLGGHGAALVSVHLPSGTARGDAAARIAGVFGELVGRLPPPGTLMAAGGETLRALCDVLGATGLDVEGRIVPGFPRSVLRGGAWDGVSVVSKSGAFGHTNLLRDLLRANILERTAP